MNSTNSLDRNTIKLFKAVVFNGYVNVKNIEPIIVKEEVDVMKHGVILDPAIIYTLDKERLDSIKKEVIELYGVDTVKLNSTFFKDWDYTDKYTEAEQKLLQIFHYMTTYGNGLVGYENGGFTPDDDKELENIDFKFLNSLAYIKPITKVELRQKVKNMLTSGIALSQDTIESLRTIINQADIKIDYIDEIANREFMCMLCDELGVIPYNFDEFTRYLIYLATGKTLLIKNKHVYDSFSMLNSLEKNTQRIRNAIKKYSKQYGVKKMAKNITRYRKLYLVIRKSITDDEVKRILNKALKLSKTLYIPRKQTPLDNITSKSITEAEIKEAAKHATVFKLVKAINALKRDNTPNKLYRIRNGKSYLVDRDAQKFQREEILLEAIKHMIPIEVEKDAFITYTSSLKDLFNKIERLNSLNKTYYIPEGVNYAVPTSEKEFVGNIPYLSYYDIVEQNAIIGINWSDPVDLDLHAIDSKGSHIGWNSSYNNAGITFSGDMTTTNRYGYAAEYMKIDINKIKAPVSITASIYDSGLYDSVDFDIFATTESVDKSASKSIVEQISSKSMISHDSLDENSSIEKTIATIYPIIDEKTGKKHLRIVFGSMSFGNNRVPGVNNLHTELSEIFKYNSEHTLMLDELIKTLGYSITHTESLDNKDDLVDLSPANVTPSTFIDLLTGENK